MFNCGCYGELSHKNDDYFILGHKHRHFSYGIVLHCNQFMFLFFYFLKAFILKIGIVSRQLFRFYDGTLRHIHLLCNWVITLFWIWIKRQTVIIESLLSNCAISIITILPHFMRACAGYMAHGFSLFPCEYSLYNIEVH